MGKTTVVNSYSTLKNPFGIRNGKTILISDLSVLERGRNCNCRCPNCGEFLLAKMGDYKIHHFAHDGHVQKCDEQKAYLEGIYSFISEYIQKGNSLTLPPSFAVYNLYDKITKDNADKYVRIASNDTNKDRTIKISERKPIRFDKSDIKRDTNGYPSSLVATKKIKKSNGELGEKYLAIIIKLFREKRKHDVESKPYENMATIELDLSTCVEEFTRVTTKKIYDYLQNKADIHWIYNPKIKEKYPEIIDICQEAQEEVLKSKQLETVKSKALNCNIPNEERQRLGFEEIKDKFSNDVQEEVRDSFGNRWFKCRECGDIKVDSCSVIIQYKEGLCRDCNKKSGSSN